MKLTITLTMLVLIISTFLSNAFGQERFKVSSRDSHQDSQSGSVLNALSANQQAVELNSENNISVQLLANGEDLVGAVIEWRINQQIPSGINGQTAFFSNGENSESGGTFSTQNTNALGISQITFNSGELVSAYVITASVTLNLESSESVILLQSFNVVTGITASLIESTPEAAIAKSIDNLCPKLAENFSELSERQKALLDRCSAVVQAATEGKTLEVSQALRQMSPEEVAVQSAVASSFTSQQISNIATRLSAVRRGTQQVAFNNLMFSYDGQIVPLGYLLSSVFSASESQADVPGGLLSKKWGVFANGNLSFGNRNTTRQEDGFEFDNYGLTIGADYRLRASSFVGGTVGFSKSDVKIDDAGGDLSANGYSIGVYATHYVNDQLYVDGIVNLGSNEYDMNRHINYDLGGSSIDRTAESNTSGLLHGLTVGAGYEVPDGALLMTFFGRLSYSGVNIDGFSETGAQELSMRIDKQFVNSLTSSLGAQLVFTHSTRWGVIMPFIWFSWEHEFSGASDNIKAAFVDDQFNSAFIIETEKEDANYFTSGQGVSAVLPRGISLYVRMENIVGREHYSVTNIAYGGRVELEF